MKQSITAKDKTIIGNEQEAISVAYLGALEESLGSKVEASGMNTQFGKNGTNAIASGDNSLKVYFPETKHTYTIDSQGKVSKPVTGEVSATLVEMYENAIADNCTNADGTCTNENHLHIGDYVNYQNPTSGIKTITASETGMDSDSIDELRTKGQTFEITDTKNQLNWRVLGLNDKGGIDLIAGSPMRSNNIINGEEIPYLFMYGVKSYINGINILKGISSMYKTNLATEARSVTQADIDKVLGVNTPEKIREINLHYWGDKNYGDSYRYENQYTPESWLARKETTVSGTIDGYVYSVNSTMKEGAPSVTTNTRIYNMLFENTDIDRGGRRYWLASRGVLGDSSYAYFGPCMAITEGGVSLTGTYRMFDSYGYEASHFGAVRPVVSLKSEVSVDDIQKIKDQVEIPWNIFNNQPS